MVGVALWLKPFRSGISMTRTIRCTPAKGQHLTRKAPVSGVTDTLQLHWERTHHHLACLEYVLSWCQLALARLNCRHILVLRIYFK